MKKALIIALALMAVWMTSCNKAIEEDGLSDKTPATGENVIVSGSEPTYMEQIIGFICFGDGVDCVYYRDIVIGPIWTQFSEVMSPLEVQAFFSSSQAGHIMQKLNKTFRSKLLSGDYGMMKNHESSHIVNYRFSNGSDSFTLQFDK